MIINNGLICSLKSDKKFRNEVKASETAKKKESPYNI